MSVIEDAQKDLAEFLSDPDEFGVSLVLRSADGQTITTVGYHTKHHLKYDNNTGTVVNTKNASIAISELTLKTLNANYPVRNNSADSDKYGEVYLVNHFVDVKDSSGEVKNYIVLENIADELLGAIVLILGDYTE